MKYEEYLKTNEGLIEPIEDVLCDVIVVKGMMNLAMTMNNDNLKFKMVDYLEERLKELGETEIGEQLIK